MSIYQELNSCRKKWPYYNWAFGNFILLHLRYTSEFCRLLSLGVENGSSKCIWRRAAARECWGILPAPCRAGARSFCPALPDLLRLPPALRLSLRARAICSHSSLSLNRSSDILKINYFVALALPGFARSCRQPSVVLLLPHFNLFQLTFFILISARWI